MTNVNPIEAAVAPLKTDACARAARQAQLVIDDLKEKLESVNGDVHALNPYPKNASRSEYRQYESLNNLINALTVPDPERPHKGYVNTPYYKVLSADWTAAFILDQIKIAEIQYDAFVQKLCAKIGPVQSAELRGNHVWAYSILDVIKQDGSAEFWKTQQIVNVSVHGKLFNQWPTRKIKQKK